ncbi:hypothetical protein DSO57_1030096 [Entomophthora muscae]|uniref:Uncharacterized protein n=1 Tax=Entomophthora muscae TaxID=34485 RepID=A0ACC2T0Z8_9FUNG|nr:hypothetical protein DSO57_1030096 [Entomophthora muscae]
MVAQSTLSLTLAGISAGCNLVVILSVALFVFRRQLLVERVSLRLQVGICFVDLIKNALFIRSTSGVEAGGCAAVGMVSMLLGHLYFLLNVMLAINAHWVLLRDHPPKRGWVLWFWVLPVLLAAFLNIPLLTWGVFGENTGGLCFVKVDNRLVEVVYVYGLTIIAYVYCLGVSILVLMKLRKDPNALLVLRLEIDPNNQRRKEHVFTNVVKLLPFSVSFPLVLCISVFLSNICLMIGYFKGSDNPALFTWGFFGYNTIGLFNLVAFFSDPMVRRAFIGPQPSQDAAKEYIIDFSKKEKNFLDSDSERNGTQVSEIIDWADKQFIRKFISST